MSSIRVAAGDVSVRTSGGDVVIIASGAVGGLLLMRI